MPKFVKGQIANPKGRGSVPGKATQRAREAIALFVDGNAHRLQAWLDDIANGVPKRDAKGLVILDKDKRVIWEIAPNPERAFTLFQSVIEYHVPKLGRQELTGPDGGGITVQIVKLSDTPPLLPDPPK